MPGVTKIKSSSIRELHGDGDDSITGVMGLNFMTDITVIARMGTAYGRCR